MRFISSIFVISTFLFSQESIHQTISIKNDINYYIKAAEQNNTQAMLKLGVFYYQGKGVKKSYRKAFNYFTNASHNGNIQATYYLGVLYSNKKTIYYDMSKSFKLFKSLEPLNHAASLNRLGMFYTFGFANVNKDYRKAVILYEKASKQNHKTAHCNLAYMYASGKGVWQNLGRAHSFAKDGVKEKNKICLDVWKTYKLAKYPEDKGWKFKFYNKPNQ